MVFVNIDEENIDEFASVLPRTMMDGLGVSLGAVIDDEVCGAISLSFDGEEYTIDWFYVTPSRRLRGVGRGLIQEVRNMVGEVGIAPIRMNVDASDESGLYQFFLSIEDEDTPIDMVYSHDRYVVSSKEFLNSSAMEKLQSNIRDQKFSAELFWDQDKEDIEGLLSDISKNFSVFDEESFAESCEKDLCVVEKRKGTIEAFVLVQRVDDDSLTLTYIYSINPKALMCAFCDLTVMLEEYGTPQRISFETINKNSMLLAQKLFPNGHMECIYEVEI